MLENRYFLRDTPVRRSRSSRSRSRQSEAQDVGRRPIRCEGGGPERKIDTPRECGIRSLMGTLKCPITAFARAPGTCRPGSETSTRENTSESRHSSPSRTPAEPAHEAHNDSYFERCSPAVIAFIVGSLFLIIGMKLSVNKEPVMPAKDMDYVRNQMETVKLSVSQLHVAHREIEEIYSQMQRMMCDFKDLADELSNWTDARKQLVERNLHTAEHGAQGHVHLGHAETCIDDTDEDINVDKMTDYALGGKVFISTSEMNYREANRITFLGLTICSKEMGPDSIIIAQPIIAGNCWAFKGQSASVFIQLKEWIKLTGFSINHIGNKPKYNLQSAPREFSLYGMQDESNYKNYGRFVYDINSTPTQYYPIDAEAYPINVVKVQFHTNYGNENYTCIYRVRIHGCTDCLARDEQELFDDDDDVLN